ncbi:unnamed protein product [Effrenium voratum]|uniref:Uncharacterized protein n=1 Tax=Effrenium voratum TaxID=2562239 RepID=A0AA36I4E6_9DINO|nr:unnamed protein product [Effrenium voratum]
MSTDGTWLLTVEEESALLPARHACGELPADCQRQVPAYAERVSQARVRARASSRSKRAAGGERRSIRLMLDMKQPLRWNAGVLRQLDLRFGDVSQELRYKQSLNREVLFGGLVCVAAGAIGVVVAVLPAIVREASRTDLPLEGFDARVAVFCTWVVNLTLMSTHILLSALSLATGCASSWNWEAFFALVVSVFAASMSLGNFWHLPLLAGQDPVSLWAHDARGSDIFVLLAIDAVLTMVAMYVPIRSCILWIPFLCAVVPYIVNTLMLRSVFADSHLILGAMLGLGAMAYHGALRRETTHRNKWIIEHVVEEAEEVILQQNSTIQETTAQVKGLRVVAEALCDVILNLDSKLHVCGAGVQQDGFFETRVEGKRFAELLTESDRSRFKQLVASSKAGFPVCMPATIQKQFLTHEVHLLLVNTGESRGAQFLVGIRIESEQILAQEEGDPASKTTGAAGRRFQSVVPTSAANVDFEEDDLSCKTYPRWDEQAVAAPTPARTRALCIKKVMPRWQVLRDPASCCQAAAHQVPM